MLHANHPGLQEQDSEKLEEGCGHSNSTLDAVAVLKGDEATVYPEGGTVAWLTVFGAFLINFAGFGYTTAFGVYQDFYVRDYLSQSSPSAISWIGSINVLLGLSLGVVAGSLYDRGYVRSVLYSGSLLQAFSLFMLSFCKPQQLYQVLLSQGIGFGIGLGFAYVPSIAIVSHYFHRRRSLAMTLTQAGIPLGALVYPILLNNILPIPRAIGGHRLSFATATRVTAALTTVLLFLGCWLVKPRQEVIQRALAKNTNTSLSHGLPAFWSSLKKAGCDWPYVLAAAADLTYSITFWYPTFFFQLDVITHGMSNHFAFYVLVIMNGSGLVGRLSSAFLGELFGTALVITASTAACSILIFSMLLLRTVASVVVLAILIGYFSGVYAALVPALIAELTEDAAEVGMRMGLCFTAEGVFALIGPPLCGALLTSRFVWWRPTLFSGIMGFLGTILFLATTVMVRHKKPPAIPT
ncbi:major facilitator superfamily domain-containing protein [Mycena amicta]|nr:major facilitator superfamily domain-containing protein [Mycena amicta]